MNDSKKLILIFFPFLLCPITAEPARIVSLSGTTTEILFALGVGKNVVGVDLSSSYPKDAEKIAKIGYMRTLSTEGILSMKPNLVVGTTEAGPKSTIEQLEKVNIQTSILEESYTFQSIESKILSIGKLVQKENEARKLIQTVSNEYKSLPFHKTNVRVLFIYSRNPNSIFVSGKNTAAHAMIELSGAINAVTEFTEYKQLTPEGLAKANPDIILIPEGSAKGVGGEDFIWSLPGMNLTKAGKEKNILIVNDLLLLGFGPRFPKAISILNQKWNSIK
ncbi:MAG: hemin ABC transporter substrate-binding protein [Leptospira sp.]|nr:hemin ABC transporter substrate-binding protein [Leptospira sp.]